MSSNASQQKKPFPPEREFKTESQIVLIEAGIKKTHAAYQKIEEILRDSTIATDDTRHLIYDGSVLTSEFLKKAVTKILTEQGMKNKEGLIISCGKDAASPHHQGAGPIFAHEPIVCDIFPVSIDTGYFADTTRTYVKGEPTREVQKMFDTVLAAQEIALDMAKPGIKASAIHATCCKVFLDAGFDIGGKTLEADRAAGKEFPGVGFTHSTGHGLGLDVHEPPNISTKSATVLQPGHVITIEPGLYYPEWGGVRVEDVVAITKDGARNLTNYPKIFIIK